MHVTLLDKFVTAPAKRSMFFFVFLRYILDVDIHVIKVDCSLALWFCLDLK